jgi:hypothetical protein
MIQDVFGWSTYHNDTHHSFGYTMEYFRYIFNRTTHNNEEPEAKLMYSIATTKKNQRTYFGGDTSNYGFTQSTE